MEKNNKELDNILEANGRIGKLRQLLISFLIHFEDFREFLPLFRRSDAEYLNEMTGRITSLLHDFAVIQKIGDRAIVNFNIEERKILRKKLPEVFEIFGWQNRIDEK